MVTNYKEERMRVAIIGGSGKMGFWFADFLSKDGKDVIITGRNEEKLQEAKQRLDVEATTDNEEAVRGADVILISVPIDNFEEVVKQIQDYVNPRQIIIDVTSIKTSPVATMHKYLEAGQVLGAHPVFGPGAKDMVNQNFVLTPTNEPETTLAQKVRQYLEARGARVTLMTPQEHDEMMVVILGLSHFISIVSADTLLSFDKFKQMEAIGGTTYKVLVMLIESVISEDPELYGSLQMHLPRLAEIEALFQTNSKAWADIVKNRDRQEFVRRMNALKDRLANRDPDFTSAYEDMYKLLRGDSPRT